MIKQNDFMLEYFLARSSFYWNLKFPETRYTVWMCFCLNLFYEMYCNYFVTFEFQSVSQLDIEIKKL